jgi:hypothetical protein
MSKELVILTAENRNLWDEFVDRLSGPEGCNFRKHPDPKKKFTWECKGGRDQTLARKILSTMPGVDVEGTLTWCREHGGFCDCEIIFNCEQGRY